MLLRKDDLAHSWLLAREERLDGARLATVKLRPVRAALLVPMRNTEAAAAVVESCCMSWGGFANCIVPYPKTGGIEDPWRRIIDVLDPDLFVCFEYEPPKEVEEYVRSKGYSHVFEHGDHMHEVAVTGTLVYSALDAFPDPQDAQRKNGPLVLPSYGRVPEQSLPFLARYGSMLETTSPRGDKYIKSLPALRESKLTSNHRDFFDVKECNARDHYHFEVPKMLNEVFVGDLGRLLTGEEGADEAEGVFATLPSSTLAGVTPMTSESWLGPRSLSEARKEDPEVVVLGDYPSVEDLALFWTLRAQRPGMRPFPLWLPYRHMYDDRTKELIEAASRVLRGRGRGGGRLHVTSASLPLEYLEETVRPLFPEADITADFADLVGRTTDYYVVEEQQPVFLRGGTARIRRIRPPGMDRLMPELDHVVHEVRLEGVRLPAVQAVEQEVYGIPGRGNRTMTRSGAFRVVDPHKQFFPGKDFMEIRLPDGWSVLEALFEHYGYTCHPTAKSRAALGQVGLLGGVEGINVVANSKVYGAMKGLSVADVRDGMRPYRADRRAEGFNYFSRAFGNQHAEPILRWLVENKLLLRGVSIKCPRCMIKLWYGVERIAERWTCDGCRKEMPIPVRSDALHWRYRVNELWANGQDQGTVAPLLALYAMHARWGSTFASEGFGYYPGIKLKKRSGASVPVDREIEIDLVALWGGRPVLVECKESAEHLGDTDEAEDFAAQLGDQVRLAEHLGARTVIVASPSRFPEDKSILTSRVPEGVGVEIEWWDQYVLLDPLYFTGNMKARDAETLHLEWLSQTLEASWQSL